MRPLKKISFGILALVVLASSAASAQRPTSRARSAPAQEGGFWELGADAAVSIGMDAPKSLTIQIPVGMVRAGYYIKDDLSLEPGLSWVSFAQKGATASSQYTIQLGVLYHLTPTRTKPQTFIHPLLAFSGGSGNQRTITSLGLGVGMKRPMFSNRMATRGELQLAHSLKAGPIPAATSINFLFGLSVYSK